MTEFAVRAVGPGDREWIRRLVEEEWGADFVVAHGVVYHPAELPGFAALDRERRPVGLVTYRICGEACEVVTLNSAREDRGIGTALMEAVRGAAEQAHCRRMWLITTNDNLRALGFYQKRGYRLVAVHRDALERSRTLKPSIPLVSANGIPICDEIEMELWIGPPAG